MYRSSMIKSHLSSTQRQIDSTNAILIYIKLILFLEIRYGRSEENVDKSSTSEFRIIGNISGSLESNL